MQELNYTNSALHFCNQNYAANLSSATTLLCITDIIFHETMGLFTHFIVSIHEYPAQAILF